MRKQTLKQSPILKTVFVLGIILLCVIFIPQCATVDNSISYNQHIRPIFNKKCLPCHGGVKQLGGFSLLFEEEAFAVAKSGKKALISGSPDQSELYQRIIHHDPDERMPKDGDPLTDNEKELISEWINQGAEWEEHWSYILPSRQELPSVDSDWPTADLDYFVLDRLQSQDLKPAEEADKETLVRRASLDLTGLPPSQDLITSYLANDAADAYELMLDDLLASPHFGERWASMWLDLARYADSRGYEKDAHRNIWRYRDWLIEALNNDMPFDEFTIEQLAGDLLPEPSVDQLIATAFHRNTMNNDEGGTEDEVFRTNSVIDRVNTTFEIWQGTTISCVQCHSHPYDPIRHEEFYEVMDIFNQTKDRDIVTERPTIYTFSEKSEAEITELIDYIQTLDPAVNITETELLQDQIKQALFPTLIPDLCDGSLNVDFSSNGIVTTWVQPPQSVKEKQFHFMFADVDVTDLSHISFAYSTPGDQARIEVRLDSINGPILSEVNLPKSNSNRWDINSFKTIRSATTSKTGKHDLFFHLINRTQQVPEGMMSIGSIELHYENKENTSTKLKAQKEKLQALRTTADRTPIMQALGKDYARTTHVFERGNYSTLGQQVTASVPDAFVKGNVEEPTDRLTFAKWLVNKNNPLTARVIVNRFWEQIFGTGIIESVEDFGTQSLPASHPELLDHLAIVFMEDNQWSIKQLLKGILMSSTYRQSSKTSAKKQEIDPFNRSLSRGARFRLSAEQIRDQALAVSGLLNDSIGGSSVMPPQPQGIWQVVYNNQSWQTAKDDLKYRRGLYTYWKRTAPYPSMVAFDTPSREFCMSRRIRTNTPLQALVTLNDPVYLEAAAALATIMKDAGQGDLETAISVGYQRALVSKPDADIISVLKELYRQSKEEVQYNTATASTSTDIYDTEFTLEDPMTVVANAILNLDGFLMKN